MVNFYLVVTVLSTALMALLVGAKIFELKTGKPQVFSRLSVSADPLIRQRIDAMGKIFGRASIANIRRILSVASNGLFHLFGITGLFVSKHYSRYSSWAKGRKFLKSGGVVSFFLKNVSESKGEKKDM